MRTRATLAILAVLISVMAILASPVVADDTPCVGLLTGTFDNVVVPPGALCFLNNAIERGNVTALETSQLISLNNQIHGDVLAEQAREVQINGDTVGGNIQITGVTAPFPGPIPPVIFVCHATVLNGNIVVDKSDVLHLWVGHHPVNCPGGKLVDQGNIQVSDNVIALELRIQENDVAQNLQVVNNTGPSAKSVQGNLVGENLQCFDNTPPFVGGPNAAQQAQGQCF